MVAPEPPANVKDAVKNWTNRGGFERISPGGEYSYIDDWGVRVTYTDDQQTKKAFICMADSGCREATDGRNLILLSGGKTSSAVKHLTTRHHLESPKTVKEVATKRKRNADIERLRTSTLYTRNPVRLNLLLETLRIINNNLPLEMVEYEESRLKEALVLRQEVQSTLTTERVNECIIEIYSSTRKEIVGFLKSNLQQYPNLTMVADMWTCKTTSDKFLGLRVYLIDNDWNFRSVLLGTRKFTPAYGDRDGGIQAPFLCWIKRTLEDFELTVDNFYGATSDKGADVQNLMRKRLHYQWEWCLAHMSHAATRASCGMKAANNSKNPGMTSLIKKMNKVIYEVKHVEVTGDLFKELCESMTTGKSTTLLNYSDARFLSVTKAMRRVLDKWQAIQAWYDERARKAIRENSTPPVFPLAGEFTTLTQVLSILQSLADLKRSCQAELPTQVDNLMMLYRIRLNDLDIEKPIRHYLSTPKKPIWIQPSDLTPLAATTRRLLQEALDKRFFIRYHDETKMAKTSFVFEMQQKLHPVFKSPRHNLNAVILKVCQNNGDNGRVACEKRDKVHQRIRDQLRNLIERIAEPKMRDPAPSSAPVYFNELEEMFAPRSSRPQPHPSNHSQRYLDEEIDRWMNDPIEPLRALNNNKPESVLSFWERMEREGNYQLLPKVVKVLFAIPMSSCQIERDFSVSGNMVTTQRTSLSQRNIDMCSFLNRNRDFIDLLQCEAIPRGQHRHHAPSCFTFPLDADPDIYMDMDSIMDDMMANFVSSATLYEEQKERA